MVFFTVSSELFVPVLLRTSPQGIQYTCLESWLYIFSKIYVTTKIKYYPLQLHACILFSCVTVCENQNQFSGALY